MHSSLIGKIEKAKVYARERYRMEVDGLHVRFHGENSEHEVGLVDGRWTCNCDFFQGWDVCSHTMALEKVLEGMVPAQKSVALAQV
ncbi:MAG: hypothetical protein WEC33_05835 [Dehalococcoidia bacterium]